MALRISRVAWVLGRPRPTNVVHDKRLRAASCDAALTSSIVRELVEAEHELHRVRRRLPDRLDMLAVGEERHTLLRTSIFPVHSVAVPDLIELDRQGFPP